MTKAEWKEVDVAFEELCNVYLPKEYLFEFRQFTRVVDRFIQDSKPFEVEAGKQYVAKFDTYCMDYVGEHGLTIRKGSSVIVFELGNEECCFEHNDSYCSMTKDQFKACFKPLENDKN